MMLKWWGYRHTNGSLHLKRYFGLHTIEEAESSPFVEDLYGPFEAETRTEAVAILKKELSGDDDDPNEGQNFPPDPSGRDVDYDGLDHKE